jgi:hypothetical protein
MNMVFGIMIDTFAALRDEDMAQRDQRENYCFICGHHRSSFNSLKKFKHHRNEEHNTLDYYYFMFTVLDTPEDLRNGYESSIFKMMEKGNADWLPVMRSVSLESSKLISPSFGSKIDQGSGHAAPGTSE